MICELSKTTAQFVALAHRNDMSFCPFKKKRERERDREKWTTVLITYMTLAQQQVVVLCQNTAIVKITKSVHSNSIICKKCLETDRGIIINEIILKWVKIISGNSEASKPNYGFSHRSQINTKEFEEGSNLNDMVMIWKNTWQTSCIK